MPYVFIENVLTNCSSTFSKCYMTEVFHNWLYNTVATTTILYIFLAFVAIILIRPSLLEKTLIWWTFAVVFILAAFCYTVLVWYMPASTEEWSSFSTITFYILMIIMFVAIVWSIFRTAHRAWKVGSVRDAFRARCFLMVEGRYLNVYGPITTTVSVHSIKGNKIIIPMVEGGEFHSTARANKVSIFAVVDYQWFAFVPGEVREASADCKIADYAGKRIPRRPEFATSLASVATLN